MASNQAVSDAALYLYRCIVSSNCTINWGVVGAALDLKPGTAHKRYSRLGQRIDKTNATLSAKWSGDLDAEGEFLLQYITSYNCQIDFNAVGRDCNLKPGTASKRYTRLLAKYKQSSEGSADEAAPAAPVTQTPASNNTKTTAREKRSSTVKDETDSNEDTHIKKRKTKADSARAVERAQVKREDQDEITIQSTVGPSDFFAEKRQTRGKKIDYHFDEVSDSEDDESDSEDYAHYQSQNDVDDYMSDSGTERKVIADSRASARSRAIWKPDTISKLPPNTPVGFAGMQIWQPGASSRQVARKTRMPPAPIDLTSTISAASDDNDEYDTATEIGLVRRGSSEVQTDHGVQLKTELDLASAPEPATGDALSEDEDQDVTPTIEAAEQQRRGFLTCFMPLWK